MRLVVNNRIILTEIQDSDKAAFLEYLNDKDISDRLFRVPYPYTDADADKWLAQVAKRTHEQGRPVNWAIRDEGSNLIGAFGFNDLRIGESHRGEIGYWLAKPFWGQGIMTDVIGKACDFAFAEFGLVKIEAHVFADNPASARVLEKNGFEQEGFFKKHFVKDGLFIDAKFFALVRRNQHDR